MLALARFQVSFVLHKSSCLDGSKQGVKSAQHSKLVRNVAGRIFPRGKSRKSLAASTLASHGGSATKKVPQAPESCQLHRLHQSRVAFSHVG